MAVTTYPGDGSDYPDWLAALMGNQANGGTPPGGSAQGYAASSGQQANMGYPASPDMGPYSPQATGAPQPQAQPPQSGFARYLAALNPISSAQAQEAEPNIWDMRHSMPRGPDFSSLFGSGSNGPQNPRQQPFPLPTLPPVVPVPADVDQGPTIKPLPGGPGSGFGTTNPRVIDPKAGSYLPARPVSPTPAPTPAPSVPGPLAAPYRPEDSPSAGPVVNEPSIRARMPAAISPVATAAAPRPGAGAGPGRSPSGPAAVSPAAAASVPPAASAPSRFTMVDRPNMSANAGPQGGGGPPQMTALNLAGLFGGGQPQAAAPAVAPAATASVRGPLASPISPTTGQPMPRSWADAAYGVPDARGAPYPYAIGPPRRAAAAAKRSGYQ